MAWCKEVDAGRQNRSLFRTVSREASGESFDAPDDCRLFFLYKRDPTRREILAAVAAAVPADPRNNNAESMLFTGRYFHVVHYMFVMPRFQNEGNGSQLLKYTERELLRKINRPIRIQSSWKAVRFFASHGYVEKGEPIDCVCGGSPLFRTLHNMQKSP